MPSIPEADRAEINNFGKNVEMLVNMLGDKLFSEVQKNIDTDDNEKVLYLKGPRSANSMGAQTSEGFAVFKNSKNAPKVVNSFSKRLKVKRKELIDSNKVQIIDREYIVIED